jgi:hypothetical protein
MFNTDEDEAILEVNSLNSLPTIWILRVIGITSPHWNTDGLFEPVFFCLKQNGGVS